MFLVKSGGDLAFEIYLPLLGPCLPLLGRLLALQAGDAQWGQHSSREGDRARDVQSGFWESKTVDFSFCPWQSPTFIPPINCKDSKSNIHVCSKMTLCAAQCRTRLVPMIQWSKFWRSSKVGAHREHTGPPIKSNGRSLLVRNMGRRISLCRSCSTLVCCNILNMWSSCSAI